MCALRKCVVSKLSIGKVLIATVVLGFTVLLLGGYSIYKNRAPIPGATVAAGGATLFTGDEIRGGQAVYQKYGLMDWGSVLGHGTYLGPDFTAEVLHRRVELLRDAAAKEKVGRAYADLDEAGRAGVDAAVRSTIKTNGYDAATDRLTVSPAEADAFRVVEAEVRKRFTEGEPDRAMPAGTISEDHLPAERAWIASGDQVHQLAAFFWWTSWLAGAQRPASDGSAAGATYTNNWPYDPDAGNTHPTDSTIWSAVSVAALVLLLPLVIWIWWRKRYVMEDAYEEGKFPNLDPRWVTVHPSQRKAMKFFVVAGLLFLLQTLLGGYMAHTYVEGGQFYGVDVASWLPFVVAKTWHLQLAIFWIAAAWMGMGIYVAPLVGGREPKKQGLLVDLLFGAVVLVAVGSLAGEWLGIKGRLGDWWWWLGHSGWEIVELGKLWQVLLAVGFGLWIVIVWRALADALKREADKGGLVHLFLLAAIAIPLMFCATFFMTPGTHLTMADYWRWWIVHLWVEGMFEVFAVIALGVLLVNMGLVTAKSTARALKFQLLILLGSGIVGTGHHYYWIGSTNLWLALGGVFSALEVVPLTLLAVEAADHWKIVKQGGGSFAYKHVFQFLTAVAFWNLFGAGVLGFLINLPSVNYFEHGSMLTANHGHAALMGVFGMLAIALALYCARNTTTEDGWSDRLFTLSFWGLNVGLMGMIVVTLTPVGVMQLVHASEHGFWAARSLDFYQQPVVQGLLWARIVPDAVFIGLGVVPLVLGLVRAFRHRRPVTPIERDVAGAPRRTPSAA
jgi:nitric oxide reductase subunit B